MRVYIFLVILFSIVMQMQAQDTLFHASKGKLVVKVIEISDSEVKYKLSTNPDGPVYVIRKKEALKIVYASGLIEAFEKPPALKKPPRKKLKHQNFVYFTVSDLLLGQLTLGYEHTLLNNHLGIRIPVSTGIIELGQKQYYDYNSENVFLEIGEYGHYNKNKIFSTGIDLFYYPCEWGEVNYFVGPSFGYGVINYQATIYTNNPSMPFMYKMEEVQYNGWLIKNGVLFMPNKHLCISLSLAMGFYTTSSVFYSGSNFYDAQYMSRTARAVEAGMSLGYRF